MRNHAETRARSPFITSLCLLLLMTDILLNTWIFAVDLDDESDYMKICNIGLWTTMMVMIPILMTIYIRVYRVGKVFELYERYLRAMKRSASAMLHQKPKQNNLDQSLIMSSHEE